MKKLLLPILFILLIGCEKEEVNPQVDNPEVAVLSELIKTDFGGMEFNAQKANDHFIVEGDILIPGNVNARVHQPGEKPKSAALLNGFWQDNTVYYAIDPFLPNKYRVNDAIEHWEEHTNIKFVERTSERDYVYFTTGNGCASYLGKIGGGQKITLARGCSTGNAIHEIGHAIGLWHEQSRSDRDEYVTVHYDNVIEGYEYNFQNFSDSFMTPNGQNLTDKLDFPSIMMYSAYSFSKNGLPTITKLNGDLYYTQRSGLSPGDIEGVNKIYPEIGEPEYINGKWYTIHGLTVLRFYNQWFYSGRYGMKGVVLINGIWFYR
ncbi:M12 family metallopeptidase [Salinimicrobium sp. GXAS 041]|uniref:M12 family metallopeptidase n=1 Tax=Salinimicrobium sp. GXAS 041 TaxID=3400806 RepID=UPI003C7899EB